MPFARPEALRQAIAQAVPRRPFEVRWWDGGISPATDGSGPVFTVRSPAAVAHALVAPGQLGLGRAYVDGALEVDDVDRALELLDTWSAPPIDLRTRVRLGAAALRAAGLQRPPRAPAAELRPSGRRHSIERDLRAVRHHYDLSNEFFALFLDESMTYSCAFFSRARAGSDPSREVSLEDAQRAKLALTADKLRLRPGQRVLDVGCGWGSFTRHAAAQHGVSVVGITLSERQANFARRRAEEEGLGDRIDIRVMDWRELQGETFDALASIGMVEHVGNANIDAYAARLAELLRPGGRLLNHGIARLGHGDPEAGPFSERFVFADAAPLHISRILFALERAGLEPLHVEGFREDYVETLRHWLTRFESRLDEAIRLGGPERVRVWRIYLRAARRGFETRFTSVFQALARRPD